MSKTFGTVNCIELSANDPNDAMIRFTIRWLPFSTMKWWTSVIWSSDSKSRTQEKECSIITHSRHRFLACCNTSTWTTSAVCAWTTWKNACICSFSVVVVLVRPRPHRRLIFVAARRRVGKTSADRCRPEECTRLIWLCFVFFSFCYYGLCLLFVVVFFCLLLESCLPLVMAEKAENSHWLRIKHRISTFHFNCIFTSHLLIKFKSLYLMWTCHQLWSIIQHQSVHNINTYRGKTRDYFRSFRIYREQEQWLQYEQETKSKEK